MKIIRNRFIPSKGFTAINLFGVLFAHPEANITETVINHEKIHTAQMKELGYVFFYLIYLFEWLLRLAKHDSNAYRNITFEQEAYTYQGYGQYLNIRKPFAQWL